jgi:serine/threonine protein kinase
VIHRDLKPENIFLCCTAEGEPLEPKVLDFGISKISGVESQNHSLTRSGAVLGTPYYMSPEQVRGARDVDERADVYAFGVMLYEALTGQRPFDAETYNQLILKIATETPEPMRTLNPAIDEQLIAVVDRAMVRDPALRFPSIESLALALEPFGGGARFRTAGSQVAPWPLSHSMPVLPAFVPVPTPPSARAVSQHRRARTTVTSAAVALVLCSLGFWWLHGTRSDSIDARARAAHRVRPAAPRAVIAPETLPNASTRDEAPPLTAAIETTTNAISVPPNDPHRRNRPGPNKPRFATPVVSRLPPPVPDKPSKDDTVQNKRALLADWDDHLSTAPAHSSTAPAGHIDERDFR